MIENKDMEKQLRKIITDDLAKKIRPKDLYFDSKGNIYVRQDTVMKLFGAVTDIAVDAMTTVNIAVDALATINARINTNERF